MKRTQEKIKDIVEPQDFDEVRNVVSDPARSLAAYRFTDATSDLLARWLDALADLPRGRGAARSLAGVRGVGKSHTLAVFGALAGQERLRQDVSDAHVATSARRLSGRRYMVVRVERGTRETLAEEMAAAFGRAFGGSEAQWGTDPADMLAVAGSRAHESTLVLIVDTGFDRPTRVRRDDGMHLGEVARAAGGANAFVALALDDDISGADGPNVAIAGAYHIDFLDHEHLFRIADTYILHKNDRGRAALHDIYLHLRASVPGFNWSEPRFSALYPVHPLVADVAAAVRLYAPAFAFLPFAAEAARRATSRPALSLVLLDEVFDRVERDLRNSPELKEAFEGYDDLATRVVGQFPVMQRLEAKLVLKTLFVLSLDGGGATAAGLCAALLVSKDSAPAGGADRVSETLARFVEAAPEALRVDEASEGGPRYRLQIGALDKFQAALDQSVGRLPEGSDAVALTQLRAAARSRFEDWPFADTRDEQTAAAANFNLAWRGSERRGRMVWLDASSPTPTAAAARDFDLEVYICAPGVEAAPAPPLSADGEDTGAAPLSVVWRPGQATPEELTTLRRLLALRTDAALAADFSETAMAAETALAAQAERVWARVYLDSGTLEVNGERKSPDDRARAARTLAAALSATLAPHFAELYPQHPQFAETLRDADVERLAGGLFAGAQDAEGERLARAYALPLGLVERRGEEHVPVPADGGAEDPAWVKEVLRLVADADATSASPSSTSPTSASHTPASSASVPLETVRRVLRRPPYGLQREAQNLILAALAAQRRVEFVNASGERADRPGPGCPLVWEEVAAVAVPVQQSRDPEESAAWARLLTGRPDLRPLSDREARGAATMALSEWLERWRALRLQERFDALPDALLTTRVWRMNAEACRRYGAAAEAVRSLLAGELTLDEGLERVADAFDNSAATLTEAACDLDALTQFVENCVARRRATAYLLTAGHTGVDGIEAARRELLAIARDRAAVFDAERNERFQRLWPEFQTLYAEHYAAAHDAAGAHTRRALDTLLAGDRWREFEMLSRLPFVTRQYWDAARELLRRAAAPRCDLPVRQLLAARTACACGFKLSGTDAAARLPRELEEVLEAGLAGYRRTLALLAAPLSRALEALAGREEERRETATRARILAAAFGAGTPPRRFSRADAQLIERAAAEMGAQPSVRAASPTDGCQLLTRDELSARLHQWLDDLPANAALVELIAGGETHA